MEHIVIETERLILKKAEFFDWMDMYNNIWSKSESAKYMLWEVTASENDAMARMERTIAFENEHKYALLVYEKSSGMAIGFAGMTEEAPGIVTETGIALGPDFTGKGYGKEILKALIGEAKNKLGAYKFLYSCRENNIASKNLCRSMGFICFNKEKKIDDRNGEEYILEQYYKEI